MNLFKMPLVCTPHSILQAGADKQYTASIHLGFGQQGHSLEQAVSSTY